MTNTAIIATFQQGRVYCQYDKNEINQFCPDMLDAQFWQQHSAITGSAQGRGTTWFVKHHDDPHSSAKHWVLRHYYRGGLIGKLINDSYWFSAYQSTRAAKEFALLAKMQQLALPAPKPIAYRVVRSGLLYQADLLSSRIENAQDLVAILSERALPHEQWKKIGATIKQFHDHRIYHHDLNAHNILIDNKDDVFIIDFDRGEVRSNNKDAWQQANVARLQRSFLKELGLIAPFHFNQDCWRSLVEGYLSH
ncbi:MAG: 3-deoxy-D-manno-octulosonic acid kinase [Colwellia sp.]|nr:3-deoxy-D-manno-octulosonic acid kinase [Colwellia sp.]MCW8864850.1 3-deoxy-D-manno-octulosonic acid kinase [Colwellia sp.]MCW9080989.1 3-deoxy-D-manno-octulosonic acid kinase [Colwellia sp.]